MLSSTYLMTSVGKDTQKKELFFTNWKLKLIQPLWKSIWRFHNDSKIINLDLPYNSVTSLLPISAENSIDSHRDI